jgi:protein dithiol:quinone oxidoreductase
MLKNILYLSEQKWYWIAFLIFCIGLESTALFYQYVLEYSPCVLCIHVRILVLGFISISLLALAFLKNWSVLLLVHILKVLFSIGLLERSYQLFGTERGFILGSCSMESGLPSWFALDEWFPIFFKVWEPCGYTPELLFGITMAEALILLSVLLLIVSVVFTLHLIYSRVLQNRVL